MTKEMVTEFKIAEPIPKLAAMVASSPLDAAIHDAYGRVLGTNSFQCMTADYLNEDLGAYLGSEFAGKYPGDYLSKLQNPPCRSIIWLAHRPVE